MSYTSEEWNLLASIETEIIILIIYFHMMRKGRIRKQIRFCIILESTLLLMASNFEKH